MNAQYWPEGLLQELAKAGRIEHPENYEAIDFGAGEIVASLQEDQFVGIVEDGEVLVGKISILRLSPEAAELAHAIDTYFALSECLDFLTDEGRVAMDMVDGECVYTLSRSPHE